MVTETKAVTVDLSVTCVTASMYSEGDHKINAEKFFLDSSRLF